MRELTDNEYHWLTPYEKLILEKINKLEKMIKQNETN